MLGDVERDGHAEQATAFADHEGDDLGGDQFGGAEQVSLVFTIFIVGNDDHFTSADIGDHVVDRVEGEICWGWHGGWKEQRLILLRWWQDRFE
jgi:hypothetical protein